MPIHFKIRKAWRMASSVLEEELIAVSDKLDYEYSLANEPCQIHGYINVPLCLYMDSKYLSDASIQDFGTSERRLTMDVATARKASKKSEILNIAFVKLNDSLAYRSTKRIAQLYHCGQFYITLVLNPDQGSTDQKLSVDRMVKL